MSWKGRRWDGGQNVNHLGLKVKKDPTIGGPLRYSFSRHISQLGRNELLLWYCWVKWRYPVLLGIIWGHVEDKRRHGVIEKSEGYIKVVPTAIFIVKIKSLGGFVNWNWAFVFRHRITEEREYSSEKGNRLNSNVIINIWRVQQEGQYYRIRDTPQTPHKCPANDVSTA